MREVNPQLWFGERELHHVPPHFVKCQTPTTVESIIWVKGTLVGRYSISSQGENTAVFLEVQPYIYFEDPSEATMFELRWAGSN